MDPEVGASGRVGDDEQLAVTHADQVTGLEGEGRGQGLAVDRGPVRGPEVLGDRRAGHRRDAEVLAGHRRVGDDSVTERRAPTEGQLAVEDDGGPEQGPGHAHQAGAVASGGLDEAVTGQQVVADDRAGCRRAGALDDQIDTLGDVVQRGADRQGVELAATMDDQVTCGSTDRDRHGDLASTPHRPQATAREDVAALRVAPVIATRSVSRRLIRRARSGADTVTPCCWPSSRSSTLDRSRPRGASPSASASSRPARPRASVGCCWAASWPRSSRRSIRTSTTTSSVSRTRSSRACGSPSPGSGTASRRTASG